MSSHDLLINAAGIRDSGTYKCIAFNVVGRWCLTHELIVQPTVSVARSEVVTVHPNLQQWMQVGTFVLTAVLALLMTVYFVVSIFLVIARPLNSSRRHCRCMPIFVSQCTSPPPPPPYNEFII
ncbi:unnamed protein product [Soboliphyme baturini]|uniref:Ig-like domain-containing protein n=1 Tax=Soboliphyme baturini TaxID=241478 RepID=A0A183IAF9_9BILA|nr:unnamed protein product [Soboliphyme baturini]